MAANNLGTLAGDLILQEALSLITTVRPVLKRFSLGLTDLDGKAGALLKGQTARTRVLSVPPVEDFGTGAQGVTTTDVPVTMTDAKEIHVAFTPAQYQSTNRDLVREQALPIATAFANYMVDTAAAGWLQANFANFVTQNGNYNYDNTIRAIRKKLQTVGVPQANRFFICNSDVYDALLGDELFVKAFIRPDNAGTLATGNITPTLGLIIDEYPALPANGENLVGFAGVPESLLVAVRPMQNPEEILPGVSFPGKIAYLVDAKTGLTVTVTQWIDPNTLIANTRLSWVQGFAPGNKSAGVRFNTAEPA